MEKFTKKDKEKANALATECSPTDEHNGYCFVAAKRMAIYKNEELRNHEQSLLWTMESILDGLCVEGEAREIAMNDFKEHLENNFD